jgi:hypothetical protein
MKSPNTHVLALAAILLACAGYSRQPAPVEAQAGAARPLARPAWLKTEPLIIVGNWDDMSIFRRRVGGNRVGQEEAYLKQHTEEAVRKLKEIGVTMAVIHFYKGFGLEAEKEQLEDSRKLVALCKKYGIRVGVYVGSTVGYETFLAEKPDAREWFAPPFLGRPVVYGDQTFRKRVYFMHPGYREYMKRVLRLAIQDLKVDLIHFDNTSLQAYPQIFFHPRAIADFRDFLRNKYSPEMLKRRLGHSEVRFIDPPETDRPLRTIDDPLFQEWADFRCAQLANYYAEMEAYIRGLNPEVAVENNPHSGISGRNTVWEQGVDYPRLLAHTDVVWTEEGNDPQVTPEGILISRIRTYKMASLFKNRVFTYTAGRIPSTVPLAEAMAYNRQTLGYIGGGLAGYDFPPEQAQYIRFYLKNFEHYRDIESRADVAVLHSFASMAFNNDAPWQSAMLFEQALIQGKVPFDIIFDENLKDLSKYRVLVLPDQECLSEEQMSLVRQFVSRGGGLVATGSTSLFTEWRLRRAAFGLGDLFRVESPEAAQRAVRSETGSGRVAYIPEVQPAIRKPPAVSMTSQYWKLPLNWQELLDAVKWAAGGELPIDVKAPLTVTAELVEQKTSGRLAVHFVNYAAAPAGRVEVTLRLPAGKSVERVTLLSPDEDKPQVLACSVKAGRAIFAVPRLKTYALALVQVN